MKANGQRSLMDVERNDISCPLLESSDIQDSSNFFFTYSHCRTSWMTQCAGFLYFFFLIFLLVFLTVFYLPRGFICCIRDRVSSYQCNDSVFIEHDLELEMTWLTSQCFNDILCISVLAKWQGTGGLKSILRKLVGLPKFWSIMGMVGASACYFIVMVVRTINKTSITQSILLYLFSLHYICMAILVPILNYTKISVFSEVKGYSKVHQVLIKVTLLVQFLVNACMFCLGFIELGFNVSGIDSNAKGTSEVQTICLILRNATVVLFYYTVQSFLWNKLFEDKRNILGHMKKLE